MRLYYIRDRASALPKVQ